MPLHPSKFGVELPIFSILHRLHVLQCGPHAATVRVCAHVHTLTHTMTHPANAPHFPISMKVKRVNI